MTPPSSIRWSLAKPLWCGQGLVLMATVGGWLACTEATPEPPRAEETPPRQFILENVKIEERRQGRVLWVGHGRRADGDLSVSDVESLVMTRLPQEPGERELTVHSPRGNLAFDDGKATFQDVKIVEPGGGVLHGGVARYDETAAQLVADGPISFTAPGMVATATSGTVYLKAGYTEIQGPVQGTYDPAKRRAELPPTPPSP